MLSDALKLALSTSQVLRAFDLRRLAMPTADASGVAVAAIVAQPACRTRATQLRTTDHLKPRCHRENLASCRASANLQPGYPAWRRPSRDPARCTVLTVLMMIESLSQWHATASAASCPAVGRHDPTRLLAHPYQASASGILWPWTGLGKMVHTSTYQYKVVQHGTCQYENSSFVQGSMYQLCERALADGQP